MAGSETETKRTRCRWHDIESASDDDAGSPTTTSVEEKMTWLFSPFACETQLQSECRRNGRARRPATTHRERERSGPAGIGRSDSGHRNHDVATAGGDGAVTAVSRVPRVRRRPSPARRIFFRGTLFESTNSRKHTNAHKKAQKSNTTLKKKVLFIELLYFFCYNYRSFLYKDRVFRAHDPSSVPTSEKFYRYKKASTGAL